MARIRALTGWTMAGFSALLLALTVFCYYRQPDHFAAFTVLPVWVWGGAGLVLSLAACRLLRKRVPWILAAAWSLAVLLLADEARVLAHLGHDKPLPGTPAKHDHTPVLRVATLNCAIFKFGDPSADLAAWQPDIVLLQDVLPYQAKIVSDALYQGRGSYCEHDTNGIATRWKIGRIINSPTYRSQQATIVLPDGRTVEVVNLHLASAATDLRFWNRPTWTAHRVNRVLRRNEMDSALRTLAASAVQPTTPILLGGDFNAPATDPVHRLPGTGFTDAFAAAGTGWAGTFQRRFPVIRIDFLYSSNHLRAVRCATAVTRKSDHRMVVADFAW